MKSLILSLFLFGAILVSSLDSVAKTQIAFLEVYDLQGRLVQYEPNSRFGHTALKIGDLWLQSYPGEGVKLVTWKELQKKGDVAEVIEIPIDITLKDVEAYLGRPFDFFYTWDDESLYCSELIAKILRIPPEPMQFNRKVWPPSYWPLEGQPGMSPDKIFRKLQGPGPYL